MWVDEGFAVSSCTSLKLTSATIFHADEHRNKSSKVQREISLNLIFLFLQIINQVSRRHFRIAFNSFSVSSWLLSCIRRFGGFVFVLLLLRSIDLDETEIYSSEMIRAWSWKNIVWVLMNRCNCVAIDFVPERKSNGAAPSASPVSAAACERGKAMKEHFSYSNIQQIVSTMTWGHHVRIRPNLRLEITV